MNTAKIVILGAGSFSFGLSMFKDIFISGELEGSTLCLVDINTENLDRMYDLAVKMNNESGAGLRIEKTNDRRSVLPGAEFVVNSVAIDRWNLWKQDFRIPRKYGIRQTYGENGGPGGVFFAMRTIPLIMDIVRDMEELCPNAWFINFSNPESRIILALGRYSRIKAVGFCHGIFMGHEDVSRIMGMDKSSVDVTGAGLNHFQWLLEIREKDTGKDLYPLLREKNKTFDPEFSPFSRKLFKYFGYYPSCSDDHIGEYLPYGWEGGEEGWPFDRTESDIEVIRQEIDDRISGKKAVSDWLVPSGERAVHAITGILHNKKQFIESGVVYNRGAITNLPFDLAVEVPVMADASGIHPIMVGDLPAPLARLLMLQAGEQQMVVEAAVNGSREMAMQALLMDPVMTSTEAAEKILDELWEINKLFIRSCL